MADENNGMQSVSPNKALKERFPYEWKELALQAGKGLRDLLASEPDLDQAWHTCAYGLLAPCQPTPTQLKISGQRLLQDAIEPLEKEAEQSA